ncbi:MAG: prepilin-type N-terminal cleavage/methylation domain-containing protein [Phycisphaerae bacterium]|nr:prepilin-type N-terminal cleavage/methylation domain-containing protein [Phycisphaerae bacterium]
MNDNYITNEKKRNYRISINRKEQGFTLIELLVVIAIISLLVSILLPSLQMAKSLAIVASCQSRLHNIGVALGIYTSEYNRGCVGFSWYDDKWQRSEARGGTVNWKDYGDYSGWHSYRDYGLGPYLEITSNDTKGGSHPELPIHCPAADFHGNSCGYAVNPEMGFQRYLGDSVENMADTPMLMCPMCYDETIGGEPKFSYFGYAKYWYWMHTDYTFYPLATECNHIGTNSCNFLFFDGHVVNQPALTNRGDYWDLWTWEGK